MTRTMRTLMLGVSIAILSFSATWAGGPGLIKMDEDSIEILEASGTATIVVERSQGDDGEVSVLVSTVDGTALAGDDYAAIAETLTWAAVDGMSKTIQVTIFDDGVSEGQEDFSVQLSDVSGGATIDPTRDRTDVTIAESAGGGDGGGGDGDDDEAGRLKFDQRSFFASEDGGLAVITVERSGGELGEVTVDYETTDGSATDGEDYLATTGTLTWADGDESSQTFIVEILADDLAEGDETVELSLFNPTGGAELDDERSTAVLTIVDGADDGGGDDSEAGELEFEPDDIEIIEGATEAIVRVERSSGTVGAITVDYSTLDGSATDGEDYLAASGTLAWADGEGGLKEFTVPILDDDLEEGNETVLLVLSNPTGGAVLDGDDAQGTLTILDSDGSTEECVSDPSTACLGNNQFQVRVVWRTREGNSGQGSVSPLSDRTSLFYFFQQENVELIVKVLDGCGVPGLNSYWVFTAGLTNVDYTLTVTDTRTGVVKEYTNLLGEKAQPVQDVLTFRSCN